jgi:hypothetical protein
MNPTTCAIVATIIALTYSVSVAFITIITEGCVIARAILAPIALILNLSSAITITVSGVVATITGERFVLVAILAPIFIIYIIPTIAISSNGFAIATIRNTTIACYFTCVSSESVILLYLGFTHNA